MPANLGWINGAGNGLFDVPANWRNLDTNQTATAPPQPGDNLVFSAALSNASLTNLHGFNLPDSAPDFSGVQLVSGYSGTVTITPDATPGISTALYLQTSGAISQPVTGTDLSVLGPFNWSGGMLNSTPSTSTVNVYGGGGIALPGEGNTLTTGSTLNFASLGSAVTTTISGLGRLLLNGLSDDAIFVRDNAKVDRVIQVGTPGVTQGIDGLGKKLTLTAATASWGYIGTGTAEEDVRVTSDGGKFHLGSLDPAYGPGGRAQVTIKLTGADASSYAYLQYNDNSTLEIMSGCVLDVSGSKGVYVGKGFVMLTGNTDLTAAAQIATIKGNYDMSGGVIGFVTPTQASNGLAWGAFRVDGNVNWSGGQYNPGVYQGSSPQDNRANRWLFTGTMTIVSTPTLKPLISPIPQFGQQPTGTWDVIVAEGVNGTVQGATPSIIQGWILLPVINANGTTTGFRVNK